MKTLFPTPKTANEARTQTLIIERAHTLEADGYRIQRQGKTPCYSIFKPGNDKPTDGWRDYKVDLTPNKEECTCDAFQNYKDCKHRIAVALKIEREADAEAEFEAAYQAWGGDDRARAEGLLS